MSRSEWVYLGMVGGVIFLVVVLSVVQDRPPDWRDSYSRHDRIAFGSRILFEVLPDIFPEATVRADERPPHLSLQPGQDIAAIFVTSAFSPQDWDTERLLEFVAAGGRVFVAANTFAGSFADSMGIATEFQDPHAALFAHPGAADSVRIHLTDHDRNDPFVFSRGLGGAFFERHDASAEVLGRNERGNPNLLRHRFGDGFFILSTVPVAFTNYAVVDEATAEYAFAALSYLPVSDVVWDESHKPMAGVSTPLRYVLSERSLTAAYRVLIVSVMLGLVMGARRRQRVIPVIKRPRNGTIDFVQTVAALYLQGGDHRGLAEKKIAHLMAYCRRELRISDPLGHPGVVASRSGIEPATVANLFSMIRELQARNRVSADDLMRLSRAMDQFEASFRRMNPPDTAANLQL